MIGWTTVLAACAALNLVTSGTGGVSLPTDHAHMLLMLLLIASLPICLIHRTLGTWYSMVVMTLWMFFETKWGRGHGGGKEDLAIVLFGLGWILIALINLFRDQAFPFNALRGRQTHT